MKYKIHGATLASLKMKTIEGGVDVVVAAMPGCNGMAESIGWVRVRSFNVLTLLFWKLCLKNVATTQGVQLPGLTRTFNLKVSPEDEDMDQFLAGTTPFHHSSFWLLTLVKFKPNGTKQQYQDYFQTSVLPSLVHAGGHLILKLNDNVRTVINGGGSLSDYDACTIFFFPNPASYQSMLSKYQYVSGLNRRHCIVATAELHAFDGQWHNKATPTTPTTPTTQPNFNLDMSEPTRLAQLKIKNRVKLNQITPNDPNRFIQYLKDVRFASDPVWQLNLLKLEPGNKYYMEYFARANAAISHSNISGNKGRKGGFTFGCGPKGVHTLAGRVKYDLIACMKYPSRDAFVQFVLSQNGEQEDDSGAVEEQQNNGHDRHVLRTAGLQIQGLISLSLGSGQGQDRPAALALTVSRL